MRPELFQEYAELQLRFAEAMAERLGIARSASVERHTNLHRRFGLGAPGGGVSAVASGGGSARGGAVASEGSASKRSAGPASVDAARLLGNEGPPRRSERGGGADGGQGAFGEGWGPFEVGVGASPSEIWRRYLGRLDELPDGTARLDWTVEVYRRMAPERLPEGMIPFGAFSVAVVEGGRVARPHLFGANLERDPVGASDRPGGGSPRERGGPLSAANAPERRRELGAMVAYIRERHPEIERVRGVSWLYGIEAYRRLFPPAYVATREVIVGRTSFQGSSSWGQMIDHRGRVKPELRERFLEKLERLDPARPWEVFPLARWGVEAPIGVFDELAWV